MTARIIHQRTGVTVGVFDTYVEAAEYRTELRRQVPPDQPCPYAIRTEEDT